MPTLEGSPKYRSLVGSTTVQGRINKLQGDECTDIARKEKAIISTSFNFFWLLEIRACCTRSSNNLSAPARISCKTPHPPSQVIPALDPYTLRLPPVKFRRRNINTMHSGLSRLSNTYVSAFYAVVFEHWHKPTGLEPIGGPVYWDGAWDGRMAFELC